MNLTETVGAGLLCAVCTLLLKEIKSPLAQLLPIAGGILLLLPLLPRLSPIFDFAKALSSALPEGLFEGVCKVLATGLLCAFGSDLCTELGAPTLGARLTLLGKIEIFLLSLPVLKELLLRVEALLL